MNARDQIYHQTIKRNILAWTTTVCLATAMILATNDGPTGFIITLLGIAVIQGYRCERAERWLRQNTPP